MTADPRERNTTAFGGDTVEKRGTVDKVASSTRANGDDDLVVCGTWGEGDPSNVTGD
jgi:hypothetical protein